MNGFIEYTPQVVPLAGLHDVITPASSSSALVNSLRIPLSTAGAQVVGSARLGALGLEVGTEVTNGPANVAPGGVFASGNISWLDTVTLTTSNPALFGFTHTLNWSAGFIGNGGSIVIGPGSQRSGTATYSVRIDVGASSVSAAGQWDYLDGVGASFTGDLPEQYYRGTTAFRFGAPFAIGARIDLTSRSGTGGGKIETFADFIGTLAWNGIIDVRTASGVLLSDSDFTLTSESGLDWRQAVAVPEPSSIALMITALPVVLLVSRRRICRSRMPLKRAA
jgi:hypothetical protein